VDEEVAEPGRVAQLGGDVGSQQARLAEDREDVGVVPRGAQALGGDHMPPHVGTRFESDDGYFTAASRSSSASSSPVGRARSLRSAAVS
jgi:hypothetical protein